MNSFTRTKLFEARPFGSGDAVRTASWMSTSPMDVFMVSSSLTFPVKPEILIETAKKANPREHKFCSVFLVGTDHQVGYFEIKNINERHKLGTGSNIILSPEYRGKGMGKEFVDLISEVAFSSLGLYRMSLSVHTINKPAILAYAKAGYSREGLIRDVLEFEGKRYSLYQMALLRPEWESKKRK